MLFRLIVTEEAHRDAVDAYDYYEDSQPGLGERFLDALISRYADLSQHPQFYSYIGEDPMKILRDVKLERFPYVVVYEISEMNEVIVYAVHNTHRDPSLKSKK